MAERERERESGVISITSPWRVGIGRIPIKIRRIRRGGRASAIMEWTVMQCGARVRLKDRPSGRDGSRS